jgi:hypothetical protein
MQSSLFTTVQLKVLRQLVELQLSHSTEVKNIIDRAWGLTQIKEKRKGAANTSDLPSADDPQGRNGLALLPLGQDNARTRYWVIDGLLCLVFCFVCALISHFRTANPYPCTSYAF